MIKSSQYALLVVALSLSACSRDTDRAAVATASVAGRSLTVIGHGLNCGTDTSYTGDQTQWFSALEVSVMQDTLVVNDMVYGMLDKRDSIVISNGAVSVNNHIVSPRPMTKEEDLKKYPLMTEHFLMSGHPIVVTSQHRSGISRRAMSKTERLEVDGTEIAVTDSRLTVNDHKRIPLEMGETIIINRGAVTVSDKLVWPVE